MKTIFTCKGYLKDAENGMILGNNNKEIRFESSKTRKSQIIDIYLTHGSKNIYI